MPNWLLYPLFACGRDPLEPILPVAPSEGIPAEFWPAQMFASVIVVIAAAIAVSAVRVAGNEGRQKSSVLRALAVLVMVIGFFAVQIYAGAASPIFPMYMSSYDVAYYFAHGEYMISMLIGLAVLIVTVGLGFFLSKSWPLLLLKGLSVVAWAILALGWIALTLAGRFCV